jgi:hypothetical protein
VDNGCSFRQSGAVAAFGSTRCRAFQLALAAVALSLALTACDSSERAATTNAVSPATTPGNAPRSTGTPTDPTSSPAPNSPMPQSIECQLFYRADTHTSVGDSATLTVHRTTSLVGDTAQHAFPLISFRVVYEGDTPDGNRVLVYSADSTRSTTALDTYRADLVPRTKLADNGFTGLRYFQINGGATELQYWCAVA